VSALAAEVLQQQPAALVPRPPLPAAPATWFHSSPAWLRFRNTGSAGAAARPEFAADEAPFFHEEKRGAAAGDEGLDIAKLGISPKIVNQLAQKGITRLFPIQVIIRLLPKSAYHLPNRVLHHAGEIDLPPFSNSR
jgi:hypothetical protein